MKSKPIKKTIKATEEDEVNIETVKEAYQIVKSNLDNLSYENKRFAFEALKIQVTIDGDTPQLSGFLPVNIEKSLSR